ncbi:DUF4221 family protein [Cyclobacterium roseum]|uniref:DUF4221 family protein n=1 Tax=Cyclobacterium roseum TaxID=2666137 RepID=UPI0013915B48|nr:DUF4221 family protein [Cyclobacterium roseum]
MKNQLILLMPVLFFGYMLSSCGSPSEKEIQEFRIHVDTVQIDPGDELLFLKRGLDVSGLSVDRRYLYNFDLEQHQLEKIDLDCLVLDRKIPFEKEGPDGLRGIHSLWGWEREAIFFSTWNGAKVFDQSAILDRSWKLDPKEFSGDVLSDKESLIGVQVDPSGEGEAYGLAKAFRNELASFVRLDLDQHQIHRYSLPLLDKLGTYTASLNDGENYAYHEVETYLEIVDSGVLFGAETGSEFYLYDPKADTIKVVSSNSEWMESENMAKGRDFASAGEFSRYFQQFMEGPHYLLPVYDGQNKRYWRLFYENYYESEITEGLFPQPAGANVYLALYDEELNLIQEAELPFLTEKPLRHFIKDGMLWVFVNLEDEMGFVRMSIDL